jgi:acetyl-CoA acetyltransferase
MNTVYVIDAVRTPVGKYGGSLANTRPDDLLAHAIKALLIRNHSIDINKIEDVIARCSKSKRGRQQECSENGSVAGRITSNSCRNHGEQVMRKRTTGHHGWIKSNCYGRR